MVRVSSNSGGWFGDPSFDGDDDNDEQKNSTIMETLLAINLEERPDG